VKERKNTCELDFSISNKTTPQLQNYVPRGETKHVCTELDFCQDVAQKAIAASIFNNWLWKRRQYVLPAPLFVIFRTAFYLFLKVKSELASCL
jgi:hypothetical protein